MKKKEYLINILNFESIWNYFLSIKYDAGYAFFFFNNFITMYGCISSKFLISHEMKILIRTRDINKVEVINRLIIFTKRLMKLNIKI